MLAREGRTLRWCTLVLLLATTVLLLAPTGPLLGPETSDRSPTPSGSYQPPPAVSSPATIVGVSASSSAPPASSDPPYPTIDGTSAGGCGAPKSYGGTCAITLSPSPANGRDVFIVAVTLCTQRVVFEKVSIASGSLSWTLRAQVKVTTEFKSTCIWEPFSDNYNIFEYEYYAVSSSSTPFAGPITVTVSLVGGSASATAMAFGIAGANLLRPFEVGTPVTTNGLGGEVAAQLTTRISHDLVFGLVGDNGKAVEAGPTYQSVTSQATTGSSGTFGEYRVFASEYVGSVSVTTSPPQGLLQPWGLIADAVVPSPAPAAAVGVTPAQGPVSTQVALSGSGFAASTTYRYCFQPAPGTSPCTGAPGSDYGTMTTDGFGYISMAPTLSVPTAARNVLVVSTDSDSGIPVASTSFLVTIPNLQALSPLSTSNLPFGPTGTGVRLVASGLAPNTLYAVWFDSVRGSHTIPSRQAASQLFIGNPTEWYVTVPNTGLLDGPYLIDIYQASSGTFIASVAIVGPGTFQLTSVAGSITPNVGPPNTLVQITLSGTFAPNAGYVVCLNSPNTSLIGCPDSLANFGSDNSGVSDHPSMTFKVPGVRPGRYYVTIVQVVGYGQAPSVVAAATPTFVVIAPSAPAVSMSSEMPTPVGATAPGIRAAASGWAGRAGPVQSRAPGASSPSPETGRTPGFRTEPVNASLGRL